MVINAGMAENSQNGVSRSLSNSYQHLSSVHKDYMYVEQFGVDSQIEILIRGGLIGGAGRRHA